MDYTALLSKFEILFRNVYYDRLYEAIQKGAPIVLEFAGIKKFDADLSDALIETPDECFRAAEEAIRNVNVGGEDAPRTILRVRGLPASEVVPIRDLRSKQLGRLVAVDGVIKRASGRCSEIAAATFECKACGQRITLLQEDQHLQNPSACECGNKHGFDLVTKKHVDVQRIELEEITENLEEGSQSRKIGVLLCNDLVDLTFQKKVVPGERVQITGILRDTPLKCTKNVKYLFTYLDAKYLELIEKPIMKPEDKKKIKELARNPKIYDMLVQSIAPSIYGYEIEKLAVALQLFGGVRKERSDGSVIRGDLHMLLIGDAQSQISLLLGHLSYIAPKFIASKGTSTGCFTATVTKNEFIGGDALEAGALILANNGLCVIDELDKMGKKNKETIQDALTQQTICIDTTNIQAALNTHAAIFATASPKHGYFDDYESMFRQIDIPEILVSMFDLVFLMRDIPNAKNDKLYAEHILKLNECGGAHAPPIDSDTLRKYVAYAKGNVHPKLTKAAEKEIETFYVGLRGKYSGEGEAAAVPIGRQHLETLIRLSEASAKIQLSNKIRNGDAKRAINVMMKHLSNRGVPVGGNSRIKMIMSIVGELQERSPDRAVSIREVIEKAEEQGVEKTKEVISMLKQSGELFEPKKEYIRKV